MPSLADSQRQSRAAFVSRFREMGLRDPGKAANALMGSHIHVDRLASRFGNRENAKERKRENGRDEQLQIKRTAGSTVHT